MIETKISPQDARKKLFAKGYVHLELGSYRLWVLKNWHQFFLDRKLIKRNAYGQYVPYLDTFKEFEKWSVLYDAFMDARDKSHTLTLDEANEIRGAGLFESYKQLTLDSGGSLSGQPDA